MRSLRIMGVIFALVLLVPQMTVAENVSGADAMICSYECTFCKTCVEDELQGICPNCGGGFSPRPPRTA